MFFIHLTSDWFTCDNLDSILRQCFKQFGLMMQHTEPKARKKGQRKKQNSKLKIHVGILKNSRRGILIPCEYPKYSGEHDFFMALPAGENKHQATDAHSHSCLAGAFYTVFMWRWLIRTCACSELCNIFIGIYGEDLTTDLSFRALERERAGVSFYHWLPSTAY